MQTVKKLLEHQAHINSAVGTGGGGWGATGPPIMQPGGPPIIWPYM